MTSEADHDRVIRLLAEQQHGVVGRRQLFERGVPKHLIDDRVNARRLIPLRRGVYGVGHRALRPEGHWLAAVLAGGPACVLSHASAAVAWRLVDRAPASVHVITGVRTGRKRPRGVIPHRVVLGDRGERTVHRAIPITSVARTILDVAATTRGRKLELVIRRAARQRCFDLHEQREVAERHSRHPGRRPLLALLDDLHGRGTDDVRSELEVIFSDLCDRHGWPRPVLNGHVEGIRVDFHWPHARLVVETDGFDFHAMPTQFELDRANDQRLVLAGWRVIRVTRRQVDAIGATVKSLLATSGSG